MVMKFRCPKCHGIFYVNPSIFKQKKTRCPYCHSLQEIDDYDRTGFHDDIFESKEEREERSKKMSKFLEALNKELNKEEDYGQNKL